LKKIKGNRRGGRKHPFEKKAGKEGGGGGREKTYASREPSYAEPSIEKAWTPWDANRTTGGGKTVLVLPSKGGVGEERRNRSLPATRFKNGQ